MLKWGIYEPTCSFCPLKKTFGTVGQYVTPISIYRVQRPCYPFQPTRDIMLDIRECFLSNNLFQPFTAHGCRVVAYRLNILFRTRSNDDTIVIWKFRGFTQKYSRIVSRPWRSPLSSKAFKASDGGCVGALGVRVKAQTTLILQLNMFTLLSVMWMFGVFKFNVPIKSRIIGT